MKFWFLSLAVCLLAVSGAAIAQPPTQPPVDNQKIKGYQLGPGDEITVTVVGEKDFDFVSRIDLKADVKTVLSKYLRNPQFNLRVTQFDSRPPATIYGEVVTPQQVKLMRKARLIELLALSGGVKEDEAGGVIQVFRTQTPLCAEDDADANWATASNDSTDVPSRTYSLRAVRAGREDSNPLIYPGDVIVVQKAAPVYVIGEVLQAQGIYLKEGGTTLSEAIAKVGGLRPDAKTKDIRIYRQKPDGPKETITANLDLIKSGKEKDVLLEPYDVVEVARAKDSVAKQILNVVTGAGRGVVSSLSGSVGYRVLY
jgi:protein involved in polysaccharide export with SLBB domain